MTSKYNYLTARDGKYGPTDIALLRALINVRAIGCHHRPAVEILERVIERGSSMTWRERRYMMSIAIWACKLLVRVGANRLDIRKVLPNE